MFGSIVFSVAFLMMGGVIGAPVGPDFDKIQYLHNLNLTYSNNTLNGLGAIDSYTDVNSEMADSLKAAINRALPGYLNIPSSTTSSGLASSSGSTGTSQSTSTSSTPMLRQKRQAGSTTSGSTTTTTALPTGMSSTTQPYGTDEEFYARTDLVHFQVNIDNLEGSGV